MTPPIRTASWMKSLKAAASGSTVSTANSLFSPRVKVWSWRSESASLARRGFSNLRGVRIYWTRRLLHRASQLDGRYQLSRNDAVADGKRGRRARSGRRRVQRRLPAVAAAILAAVEGGILPAGTATPNEELTAKPTQESAGQDARLYGRRDARHYAPEKEWRPGRFTG